MQRAMTATGIVTVTGMPTAMGTKKGTLMWMPAWSGDDPSDEPGDGEVDHQEDQPGDTASDVEPTDTDDGTGAPAADEAPPVDGGKDGGGCSLAPRSEKNTVIRLLRALF